MKLLWKAFLRSNGWNVSQSFPFHHLQKYIVIVGPHTSNWDFVVGVAYRSILNMNYVHYLGKAELFRPPFGWIFRNLGGIPVDRKSNHNMVDAVADLFLKHERIAIAIAPEGTRKKVEKLKTGFYFIAAKATVPIVMVGLDYRNKTVRFSDPLYPTDQAEDFELIYSFYRTVEGKIPELGLLDTRSKEGKIYTS